MNSRDVDCVWTIIADDPAKKVVVTFTYSIIFLEGMDGCLSKIEVFDGDSDKGALKASFCGSKTPPAIYSNGNALTVKLNKTSLGLMSEFDIHYSVMDNGKPLENVHTACRLDTLIQADFMLLYVLI